MYMSLQLCQKVCLVHEIGLRSCASKAPWNFRPKRHCHVQGIPCIEMVVDIILSLVIADHGTSAALVCYYRRCWMHIAAIRLSAPKSIDAWNACGYCFMLGWMDKLAVRLPALSTISAWLSRSSAWCSGNRSQLHNLSTGNSPLTNKV